MAVAADVLGRFLGEATVERGQHYHRQGRVVGVERRPSGMVVGLVRGTAGSPYSQHIRLQYRADGALRSVAGQCSCPVGYNCKHVAAALLALGARGATALGRNGAALPTDRRSRTEPRDRSPEAPGLPPALRGWLERLRAADASVADPDGDYPPEVRDRLLYG